LREEKRERPAGFSLSKRGRGETENTYPKLRETSSGFPCQEQEDGSVFLGSAEREHEQGGHDGTPKRVTALARGGTLHYPARGEEGRKGGEALISSDEGGKPSWSQAEEDRVMTKEKSADLVWGILPRKARSRLKREK